MTLPDLEALVSDVRRLLAAGAVTSTGDERLCRRAAALQQLGQKVPVLAQVALAVQRVIEARPTQATAALLDLLLLVQQIRPSLTNVGVEGAPSEIEPSGPWTTAAATGEVNLFLDAIGSPGRRRNQVLSQEPRKDLCLDLRLLQPLASLWVHGGEGAVDLLMERVIPHLPPAAAAAVWEGIRAFGRKVGWYLLVMARANLPLGEHVCVLALGDSDMAHHQAAAGALSHVQNGSSFVVPALIQRLQDPREPDRAPYIRVLHNLGPVAKDAIPALIEALSDPVPQVQIAAAEALREMGPVAEDAIPALKEIQSDAVNPELSRAARVALGCIQRKGRREAMQWT